MSHQRWQRRIQLRSIVTCSFRNIPWHHAMYSWLDTSPSLSIVRKWILQKDIRVLGQSLSGLPSKFNFNWSSLLPLSAHVGCIQVNALFHILFASLHTLAFFQVLLHTSAFFLGMRSEIWLMLVHFWGGSCMLAKHNMLLYCHRAIQPTQQLLYLEVYNLNLAAWFTFQHQSM